MVIPSVFSTLWRVSKKAYPNVAVLAGNVATTAGTQALIDVGADAVKVGIGPGSICTTRIVAGVGVPQLSAIMSAVEAAQKQNIPVIADGGIKFSAISQRHLPQARLRTMAGSLLAGTEESPGEVYLHQGRSFKAYRGMGSVGAMARGSADRYFQAEVRDELRLVPEGIEEQVAYKGADLGGPASACRRLARLHGYVGAKTLEEFREKGHLRAHFQCGPARKPFAWRCHHYRESPNYPGGM